MIEARGLTRRYGDHTAVDDVSFSVDDGEILGILGPNGAGKTTTLRMITGVLPPTRGTVTLDGEDLAADTKAARRKLGYLPENVALYPEMRVDEYLRFRAGLAGMSRGAGRDGIDRAVSSCLLEQVRQQIIGTLSKGYRQRVGLAAAILHGPQVLVLDEPTVGLDPNQIIAIRELIRDLGRERTLLLSTHILPEVEQLCDRVVIIDRGRLVAEGTPQQLQQRIDGAPRVRLKLKTPSDEAKARIAELPSVTEVDAGRGQWLIHCAAGSVSQTQDPREDIFRLCAANDWVLLEMQLEQASLEDLFVRLTADQAHSEAPDQIAHDEPTGSQPTASQPTAAEPVAHKPVEDTVDEERES